MKTQPTAKDEVVRCSICGTVAHYSGVLVAGRNLRSFNLCEICGGYNSLRDIARALFEKEEAKP